VSITRALARFRRRQADQLTARATIRRPLGAPIYDPELGQSVQPVAVIGTDVPCKVTALESFGRDAAAGQTEIRINQHMVKLPVGTDVRTHDVLELTASQHNPADVGLVVRVTDVDRREWQIARRCIVEEITAPTVWQVEEEGS
jgi:hypothetical protein